ncbi:MAG: DUF2878 family protein [Proteobacteria bacterium]|nr:DUF2878 family protein [Pseudomonadota bacterium]
MWLATALGAANGTNTPAIAAASFFCGGVLLLTADRRRVFADIIAAAALGFVIETGFTLSKLISYSAPWPSPSAAPAWMIALWAAFGATTPLLADALGSRPIWLAAALGAIGGALAYLAGSRLGALEIGRPGIASAALLWAFIVPSLIALDRRLTPPR